MKMIKWLVRLFIVWGAIIFVASANEEILYGWQKLVEASNEAASATTTGHAAFPPVERESRTVENVLDTRKKARLQTDKSDGDLLTIGLGTRGGHPSYHSSLGQSSKYGVISETVSTENPIHLANNYEPFKLKSHDPRLFPSDVSLKQVNSQASSSTTTRDLLSDFDNTSETDASASTRHYIPSPTNPPESHSQSFNLGRNTQFQGDAPITQGPLGNSVSHKQDGGRGKSSGQLLSLKTGVTLDEEDAQHSYATGDFLQAGFASVQPNGLSAKENCIAPLQFSPQEIQQIIQKAIWLLHLGIITPSYQNAGASMASVLSAGGIIPQEMSSMAGQNGGNVLSSSKPSEQGENEQSWRADQGTTSFPMSQPKQRLKAERNILVDWPKLTEPLLNQSSSPHHNLFQSGHQGSSSENPEHIPEVSKMPKPHQPDAIMAIGNHPIQCNGIKKYGGIKFNIDLFNGEGPYQLERSIVVEILNAIPRPYQGNFLLADDQLVVACLGMKRKHSIMSRLSMTQIEKFMGNINGWNQYWNTHANIDLSSFPQESKCHWVFPLFLIYVEMIISIIPYRQEQKLNVELDYAQEMENAIKSYLEFNTFLKTQPERGESTILMKKRKHFKQNLHHATITPSGVLWTFIEVWMKSHYTAAWNNLKETSGAHVCDYAKAFFNTIFAHGIETMNEKLHYYLAHE